MFTVAMTKYYQANQIK